MYKGVILLRKKGHLIYTFISGGEIANSKTSQYKAMSPVEDCVVLKKTN